MRYHNARKSRSLVPASAVPPFHRSTHPVYIGLVRWRCLAASVAHAKNNTISLARFCDECLSKCTQHNRILVVNVGERDRLASQSIGISSRRTVHEVPRKCGAGGPPMSNRAALPRHRCALESKRRGGPHSHIESADGGSIQQVHALQRCPSGQGTRHRAAVATYPSHRKTAPK